MAGRNALVVHATANVLTRNVRTIDSSMVSCNAASTTQVSLAASKESHRAAYKKEPP